MVWVTIGMVERSDIESWTGTDGKQYDWCMDDQMCIRDRFLGRRVEENMTVNKPQQARQRV